MLIPKGIVIPFQETKLFGSNFERYDEKIMGWLKDPEARMIGVWGMGGVGKTALLKCIYNKLIKDDTISQSVYWLDASECDNVYKWQESIATCFGLNLIDRENEMIRSAKLYSSLVELRNIVLIVDDIWQPFFEDEVGIPLGKNGWKIILTTRRFDLCQRMRRKNFIIKVNTLHDEDAELFSEQCDNTSFENWRLQFDMLYFCGGLPLAIVTMAQRVIGVVDSHEYDSVIRKLENSEEDIMIEKVFSKLQLSYDRLQNEMVQNCFLSSVLYLHHKYSDDDEKLMYKKRLINLWIHEGLLDKIENEEARLSEGHVILMKLINSCLLENNPENRVGMHEVIQQMVVHYTRKNCIGIWINNFWNLERSLKDKSWGKDLIKVLLIFKGEQIQRDMSPRFLNLRVLVLQGYFSDEGLPDSFFVHMKALRVLDLSHTVIKKLPRSVSDLTDLRVLLLNHCLNLEDMPSLEKLVELRILDLSNSLSFEGGGTDIENLKYLEELNYHWRLSYWSSFNKLVESGCFSSLLCYNFVLYDYYSYDDDDDDDDCNKKMRIISAGRNKDGAKRLLPSNLESLKINDCGMEGCASLVDALSLFDTTNLEKLKLYDCRGIKYILRVAAARPYTPSFKPLNSLETLSLDCLCDLDGIIKLEGSWPSQIPNTDIPFYCLRLLTIQFCDKIKEVPLPKFREYRHQVVCKLGGDIWFTQQQHQQQHQQQP